MPQKQYSYYTKFTLNDVYPQHKRAVKMKDQLISHEASHTDGQGVYKRIQCRYDTKSNQAILIFLGFEAQKVLQAVKSRNHELFTPNFHVNQIDTSISGTIMLNQISANTSYYEYKLSNYIPFSNDGYKIFNKMKRSYHKEEKLTLTKHPFISHHIKCHIMVHLTYMMKALFTYRSSNINELDINIHIPIHHRVINFKSKESAFDLSFTSNIWLPEDLNIGNHVAYGFGQLELIGEWRL